MLTDRLTNQVYFSEWIRQDFPVTLANVCRLLEKHGVKYGLLPHTRDYWCRDYMPVQVTDQKFVRYTYYPDYLRSRRNRPFITNPDRTLDELGIKSVQSALIIDGGNVVKCSQNIIMTEKVFWENQQLSPRAVVAELERLFECEIVFLPWDRSEPYGHADGIVRWVADDVVLLTAYEQSRHFARKFREALERHFNVIPLVYTTRPRSRNLTWAYINFLQTQDVILVPAFGIKEDVQAMRQFEEVFSDYRGRIEQVDVSDIVGYGGALNCISWNIKV